MFIKFISGLIKVSTSKTGQTLLKGLTSPNAASAAGKVLRDMTQSPAARSAAASALAQAARKAAQKN